MPVPVPVPAPIPIPAPAPVEVQLPAAVAEQEPPKSSCCCSSKKKTTITTSSLPPAASEIKPEPAPLPPPPAPVPKSCPATSIRTICVPDADGCPCGSNTTNLLISLRRIIRNAADEEAKAATPESPEIQSSSKNEGGANSLSIALSIAQSATTQCSCSANCTNCASDPSLPLTSATVLGLALQVYLQAIRVLQSQSQKSVEGLEVMVGGFRVGPRNARRVALYATGLELRGLRGAMDEVIRRGDGNGNGDEEEGEGEGEGEGQGVVGIMVGKMRRQLGRAIETVDRMLREAEEEGA
ncbi:hypothetical protein SAICODRAFT_32231 [Saitoella complicata NRRL Y-17804]|nr:uncharacterized protein SAICODRAFT_32231 [Saitoella complicata NRRL Y-17804]ODQ49924.1 hypothetical protein SAICODRAFT_32231 [Saitoella complicata NRRL Y-17804]